MKYNPQKFNIKYRAIINFLNAKNDTKMWVVKLSNSSYQKIERFSISQKPQNIYKDGQENKILYFEFKNQKKIDIKIDIKVMLWKNKINLKKRSISLIKLPSQLINKYTKSERFLEQIPEIKKLTLQITKNDKSALDKIQSIFNFVTQKFKYCYPVRQRGVKYLNLNNLKGDCGEYSGLFIVMCRILKIPARDNTGFVIFKKEKKIVEHGWASVYLKPYGWITIDPQYASLEKDLKTGIKKYFGQNSDYRITFTNGFNIPLKPAIPRSFRLDYWNKIGLPLNNESVQTLQPIVFVSKKEVKFKDSIKLI
ncbi:MAG: transglutaminase-like domain-containing protein [Candidatus Tagabacteria bacterium]